MVTLCNVGIWKEAFIWESCHRHSCNQQQRKKKTSKSYLDFNIIKDIFAISHAARSQLLHKSSIHSLINYVMILIQLVCERSRKYWHKWHLSRKQHEENSNIALIFNHSLQCERDSIKFYTCHSTWWGTRETLD